MRPWYAPGLYLFGSNRRKSRIQRWHILHTGRIPNSTEVGCSGQSVVLPLVQEEKTYFIILGDCSVVSGRLEKTSLRHVVFVFLLCALCSELLLKLLDQFRLLRWGLRQQCLRILSYTTFDEELTNIRTGFLDRQQRQLRISGALSVLQLHWNK